MMQHELSGLRLNVSRILIPFIACHVPLVAAVAYYAGHDLIWPVVVAAANTGAATLVWFQSPGSQATRMTIGVSMVIMVSILLATCDGAAWQADIHMYYFAALAITAAYCDVAVILACAAAVAVHHLGLNFIAPALVFPGGPQLARVILHAVILVTEAAALVLMSHRLSKLIADRAKLAAETVAKEAEAAREREALRQLQSAETERLTAERRHIEHEAKAAQDAVVSALAAGLDHLANGDFTNELGQAFPSAYEKLRADFNATAASLRAAISTIATATGSISTGAAQIASGSDSLSRRTEQQAANLEETAAALNGITGAVKKMSAGASEAAKVVLLARGAAESSGAVVQQAVGAMGKIKDSSNQITQIIGVIDEIAFQTNLLALNAGVEAARAGDAGRGFAVVASEVRALAQRSAEAAKQIEGLIQASTTQVETGVVLVDKTGHALQEIIAKITEMDALVQAISETSKEQATGLAEINIAVGQMDHAVQQNAAMVEESAAAAHALQSETSGLTEMIGRFRIAS